MFCVKCGAGNVDESLFCASCGSSLSNGSQRASSEGVSNPTSSYNENIQKYYEAVIGYKNSDYYLSRFTRFDFEGAGISWNWPAFFVSFYWLLYRKMWVWALLYFLLPIPLTVIAEIVSTASTTAVGIIYLAYFIVIFIVFPMYANSIYYGHVKAKIQKAKNYSSDRERRVRTLSAEGGTCWIVLVVIVVSYGVIATIGIFAAIAIPAYQDYTLRAKVMEGLAMSKEYKRKVVAYVSQYGQWPSSNADIGLESQINSANIANISVGENGVIVITYANVPQLNGKSVALVPTLNKENILVWGCKGIDIENKLLPLACRK